MKENKKDIQEIPEFKITNSHLKDIDENFVDIDFENYEFSCIKCGDCCKKIITKAQRDISSGWYEFDYRGKLVKDPIVSINVFPFEKDILTRHSIKILPNITLFVKGGPIAFNVSYQIKVNNEKDCIFYDSKGKACMIYSIRPIACYCFPAVYNYPSTFILDHGCTSFRNKLLDKIN